jgi:hypothetical protein
MWDLLTSSTWKKDRNSIGRSQRTLKQVLNLVQRGILTAKEICREWAFQEFMPSWVQVREYHDKQNDVDRLEPRKDVSHNNSTWRILSMMLMKRKQQQSDRTSWRRASDNNQILLNNASSSLTDIIVFESNNRPYCCWPNFQHRKKLQLQRWEESKESTKVDFHYKLAKKIKVTGRGKCYTRSSMWRVIKNEDARTVFNWSFIDRPSLLPWSKIYDYLRRGRR